VHGPWPTRQSQADATSYPLLRGGLDAGERGVVGGVALDGVAVAAGSKILVSYGCDVGAGWRVT